MEELELLKKDWKKNEAELPKLSRTEIYQMIWKRSTSLVKWIFYISVVEFAFWTALNIISSDSDSWQQMRNIHIYNFTMVLTAISYIVLVYFIYKFYINYKKISFTDSSKNLMKAILEVKGTVTKYVWFNLSIFLIACLGNIYGNLRYGPDGDIIGRAALKKNNEILYWFAVIVFLIVGAIVILGILWLFYKLFYGILLKKLRKNYNELRQMEV